MRWNGVQVTISLERINTEKKINRGTQYTGAVSVAEGSPERGSSTQ